MSGPMREHGSADVVYFIDAPYVTVSRAGKEWMIATSIMCPFNRGLTQDQIDTAIDDCDELFNRRDRRYWKCRIVR